MTEKAKEGWRAFIRIWVSPIITIITGVVICWHGSRDAVSLGYGYYVNAKVLIDTIHYSAYRIHIIETKVSNLEVSHQIDSIKLEQLIAKQP